ncbi:MAG TPA: hypothetical protein VNO50_09690 [Pyrinomonadaceae bacterium]|nr:hypothetical protein [Pyrinomonadaceae bacterium]
MRLSLMFAQYPYTRRDGSPTVRKNVRAHRGSPPLRSGYGPSLAGLALAAALLFLHPLSLSAQERFRSLDAFLKSTLKAEDGLNGAARGDLNSDGLLDWAGVIHRRPADASPTYQLYVLLRQRGGGFQVAEKSIEEEIPGMGCCWVEHLEIRRGSIYVQNNAKTATVMEAVTHQFKLHEGLWRLVGIKSYYTDHGPESPGTRDTQMNLLTGLVIEKSRKGNRKPANRSRRQNFETYLLKDFDFSIRFANE